MSHPLDRESAQRAELAMKRAQGIQQGLFKKAAQAALADPNVRHILWEFMQQMGLDRSPFNPNAMTQSHNIGKQEAVGWFLNVMREHCPEREAQVRIEGVARDKQAMQAAQTNEDEEQ